MYLMARGCGSVRRGGVVVTRKPSRSQAHQKSALLVNGQPDYDPDRCPITEHFAGLRDRQRIWEIGFLNGDWVATGQKHEVPPCGQQVWPLGHGPIRSRLPQLGERLELAFSPVYVH